MYTVHIAPVRYQLSQGNQAEPFRASWWLVSAEATCHARVGMSLGYVRKP